MIKFSGLILTICFLVLVNFLNISHTFAPDHFTYFNVGLNEEGVDILSNYRYEIFWGYFIYLFHTLIFDAAETTPFYAGILCYFIGILLLIKDLDKRYKIIFIAGCLFSYTGIISSTIDKTCFLILLIACIIRFFKKYQLNNDLKCLVYFSGSMILLFGLRAWLIPFVLFLLVILNVFSLKLKKKIFIFSICLSVVYVIVMTLNTGYILFILKFIFVFPFILVGPLPKNSDKFFEDSLLVPLIISFLTRIIILLFMVYQYKKQKSKEHIYILLSTIIFLSISVTLHSAYFELQDDDIGVSSDAVRKVAFYWPFILYIILKKKEIKRS